MQNLHSRQQIRGVGVGPRLIPASIVFFAAVFLFVIIAVVVALSPAVTAIDGNVATWLHVRATPQVTDVMAAISLLGAPTTLTIVAAAGSLLLLHRRRYAEAALLSTVVIGGNFLNFCLKHLIQRGRPVFDDPLFSLPTYSFPSGHAMASTVFYGLLAIYVSVSARQRYAAPLAIGAAVLMVALVSFSRVYLGLHYPSDVMGGLCEGIAWLALSVIAWQHRRRREARLGVNADS
ncbi:MAG TPA: phosphatase PAP2 family protein [Casimicrobiaceae bacterium]|nr:phosphatase PAP2 family protein [Casimicrobiaceae bacterium]